MADKYDKVRLLGKGTFGNAWLVRNLATGKQYVSKEIAVSGLSERERLQAVTEVEALARCKHVNIVRYREAFVNNAVLHIVMSYADAGDLQQKVRGQNGIKFSEQVIIDWFVQICFALQYIHSMNILHRDLKSQNIFLTCDNFIKLGDFGVARFLENSRDHANTAIGTPYYMSPEICQQQPYNHKSDIWSAGCVLYELCTLRYPFDGATLGALIVNIMRGKYAAIPSHYCALLEDLVHVMLNACPERRPSADQLLNIPALQSYVTAYVTRSASRKPQQRGSPVVVDEARCTSRTTPTVISVVQDSSRAARDDTQKRKAVLNDASAKRSPLVPSSVPNCYRVVNSADPVSDGTGKHKVAVASGVPKTSLFKEVIQRRRAQSESKSPEVPGASVWNPLPRLRHNGKTYIVKPHPQTASDVAMASECPDHYNDVNNNSSSELNKETSDGDDERSEGFDTTSPTVVFRAQTPDGVKTCRDKPEVERAVRTEPRPNSNKQTTESGECRRQRKVAMLTRHASENMKNTPSPQASTKQRDTSTMTSQMWLCTQLYRSFSSTPTEVSTKIETLRRVLQEKLGTDQFLYNYAILRRNLANGDDFQHAFSRVNEDKRQVYLDCFPLLLQLLHLEALNRTNSEC